MDLNDYNDVRRTKAILYGPPKSGKTRQLAYLAEAGYTLWVVDGENGIKTLMNPEVLKPEFRKNVKLINMPDRRDYPVMFDGVRQILKGLDTKFCYLHGKDKCPLCAKEPGARWADTLNLTKFGDKDILVIETLTQLSNSAINKRTLKAWQKDDEYKPTWDDFRAQGMDLDEVLGKIQVANVNVLVTSHDVDVEKSESKEKIVPVAGTRNFSKISAKYFDEVIYLQVQNKKHSIYSSTMYSNNILTGGRSGIRLEDGEKQSIVDIFKGTKS